LSPSNNFIVGGNITYNNSLIQGHTLAGVGNLSGTTDPQFINWIDPTQNANLPSTAGDYRLQCTSPCLNVGDSALYMAAMGGLANMSGTSDLDGNTRLIGANIDMGAYEDQLPFCIKPDSRGIVYVNLAKNGDGSSWENAYKNLADPLLLADMQRSGTAGTVAPADTIRQIWVAEGTYYPMHIAAATTTAGQPTSNRYMSFVLVKGVKIYGGFPSNAATGTHNNIDSRFDPNGGCNAVSCLPPTVLSGDLNDDDTPSAFTNGTRTDNVYHLIIASAIAAPDSVVIDGLTIRRGHAAQTNDKIYVNANEITTRDGGGIFNHTAAYSLKNLIIEDNYAAVYGGGIYSCQNSELTANNIIVRGNSAASGGGVAGTTSNTTINNTLISGNKAGEYGGGIYNEQSVKINSSTIVGNSSQYAGGGLCDFGRGSQISNSIFWGNKNSGAVNNIEYQSTPPIVYANSIVEGVDLTGSGSNNLNGSLPANNPQFTAAAVAAAPTLLGDYSLAVQSPLIDRGDSTVYKNFLNISGTIPESAYAYDLAGNSRLRGNNIEIGAFEVQNVIFSLDSVYIAMPRAADTLVCEGSSVTISGNYKNNDIFSRPDAAQIELDFWWEYTTDTINNAPTLVAGAPTGKFPAGLLAIGCTINPATVADTGYYRLVVENNSAYGQYFKITSRYVHLLVYQHRAAHDIRLFIHPDNGLVVNLTAYIDSIRYPAGTTVKWIAGGGMPAFANGTETTTGTLDGGDFAPGRHTYTYTYELDACGVKQGKAYIHTVDHYSKTSTVEVCRDVYPIINLSRLFGVAHKADVNGSAWSVGNDPSGAVAGNMTPVVSGKHAGAMTFNAWAAYNQAVDASYDGGTVNNRPAKRFEIIYTAGTITKTVWIVVY
jgi:hypothetical protein